MGVLHKNAVAALGKLPFYADSPERDYKNGESRYEKRAKALFSCFL